MNGETYGRVCGRKPKQAANKAFSSIFRSEKEKKPTVELCNNEFYFSIQECTRKSKHNVYTYTGQKTELSPDKQIAVVRTITDPDTKQQTVKEVKYKYKNVITKVLKQKPEQTQENVLQCV